MLNHESKNHPTMKGDLTTEKTLNKRILTEKTLTERILGWGHRHTHGLVAFALGLSTFVWLFFTLETVGIGRDEGLYINAAETYWNWAEGAQFDFKKMRQQKWLDRHYNYNWEHPPLVKHLAGWSWRLFHRCECPKQRGLHRVAHRSHRYKKKHSTLGWMGEIQAFRLPTVLLTSLLVGLLYLFGAAAFGPLAGLTAAALYITMPRVFFHSHLAALDAPVTATMFFAVYAYWKSLHKASWSIPAGLLFGVALSVKLNAFFLPLLLALHYAYASRDRFRSPLWAVVALALGLPAMLLTSYMAATTKNPWAMALAGALLIGLLCVRKDTFKKPHHAMGSMVPAVFWLQALLGLGLLFLTWPRLWPAPLERFGAYLGYHLHHVFYNTEYFGQNLNLPPFPVSFPFVMTLITVPAITLLLAMMGLGFSVKEPFLWVKNQWNKFRKKDHSATHEKTAPEKTKLRGFLRPLLGRPRNEAFLVGVCALFPLVLISFPSTPIFGGTRTWMTAMPFVALLAGIGLQTLFEKCRQALGWKKRRSSLLAAAAFVAVVAPGLFQTLHAGHVAPSYYTPLAGGTRGGASLGMKRQYWGYTSRHVMGWLNKNLPKHTRLYPHDTIYLAFDLYHRDGLLKKGIRSSGGEFYGVSGSRYALFEHEKHQVMWEFLIWQEYGTFQPAKVFSLDGVPLLYIYGPKKRRMGPPYFMDPPDLRPRHRRRRKH